MNDPAWLDKAFILAIHGELLTEFGGTPGLLSANALESTLSKPQQLFYYGEGVMLYQLAAAYAYGFIKNHCFVDGNKRVAFVAAYTFLGLNGLRLIASQSEALQVFLELAAALGPQEVEIENLARWLERNCTEI